MHLQEAPWSRATAPNCEVVEGQCQVGKCVPCSQGSTATSEACSPEAAHHTADSFKDADGDICVCSSLPASRQHQHCVANTTHQPSVGSANLFVDSMPAWSLHSRRPESSIRRSGSSGFDTWSAPVEVIPAVLQNGPRQQIIDVRLSSVAMCGRDTATSAINSDTPAQLCWASAFGADFASMAGSVSSSSSVPRRNLSSCTGLTNTWLGSHSRACTHSLDTLKCGGDSMHCVTQYTGASGSSRAARSCSTQHSNLTSKMDSRCSTPAASTRSQDLTSVHSGATIFPVTCATTSERAWSNLVDSDVSVSESLGSERLQHHTTTISAPAEVPDACCCSAVAMRKDQGTENDALGLQLQCASRTVRMLLCMLLSVPIAQL